MKSKSGRVFQASLKPYWSKEKSEKFAKEMKGTATVYIINHDKDTDEDGVVLDTHTHVYLEYETPRKISTIANLLGVAENFVEIVKSKKGMLRYLTHKDETDKHKYDDDEVITNSPVPYKDVVLGASLSDKEIADYLINGKGFELLGVVSASKLRTIQSFLAFDRSGEINKKLDNLTAEFENVSQTIKNIDTILNDFEGHIKNAGGEILQGFKMVADEINKVKPKLK